MSDDIRVSIIVPILDSHEVVRRQILHLRRMHLPPSIEVIFVDDGSDPPLASSFADHSLSSLTIVSTGDSRPWTWALARNFGARLARGSYLFMTDIDYIIPQPAIDAALLFSGDKLRFRREFGILDSSGYFSQSAHDLISYGIPSARIAAKGASLPPHPNNFCIRADLFWAIGGYREDLISRPYPQGEDRHFKKEWVRFVSRGWAKDDDPTLRPLLYMIPNGQFCSGGDVDSNPFSLFHKLTRKSGANPYDHTT